MKKYALSLFVLIAFAFYILFVNQNSAATTSPSDLTDNTTGTTPTSTSTQTPTSSTSGAFAIGSTVSVSTGPLRVRSTPSMSGATLGAQTVGSQGTILGGPVAADNVNWWNISYADGVTGWSAENFLTNAVATQTTPTSTPATTGQYKDGSYTGDVANAIYGKLQVVAVISGGAITDVQFPVYPNDSGHSQQVSGMALPILKQEALTAQNANVNIVSGATQTSEAFQESLGIALQQATP